MSDADKDVRESKIENANGDDCESLAKDAGLYYYDDSTNYETFRDDVDDDEPASRDDDESRD